MTEGGFTKFRHHAIGKVDDQKLECAFSKKGAEISDEADANKEAAIGGFDVCSNYHATTEGFSTCTCNDGLMTEGGFTKFRHHAIGKVDDQKLECGFSKKGAEISDEADANKE